MDILVILYTITKEWVFLVQTVIVCLSKPTPTTSLLNKQSNCEWTKLAELMASSIGIISKMMKIILRNSTKDKPKALTCSRVSLDSSRGSLGSNLVDPASSICLTWRLSHACLSISYIWRNCEWLIKSEIIYLMIFLHG